MKNVFFSLCAPFFPCYVNSGIFSVFFVCEMEFWPAHAIQSEATKFMDTQKMRKNGSLLFDIHAKVFSFTNNNQHLCNAIDTVYSDSGAISRTLNSDE